MTWTESFDAFSIYFSHSKTDQLGEEAKYARHVYSNPLVPLICPAVAISLYFSSCFNTRPVCTGKIFPGQGQAARFSTILLKLLQDKVDEVNLMGYPPPPGVLGTHPIRKGAVSYLASLPGGPPAASTCIRAGWTMGRVKDIYMWYVTSGDQLVGRCLTLLSVLRTEFAVSPCHFKADYEWVEPTRKLQFPMVGKVDGFEKMSRMCLAAVLFHHGWLSSYLPVNHVFLQNSYIHRTAEILARRDDCVQITYPWDDENNSAFTGVPPHIVLMQQLQSIKQKQQHLVSEFVAEVTGVISAMGVDGGRLTEQHLRQVLQEFQQNFLQQLQQNNINILPEGTPDVVVNELLNAPESGRTYVSHVYNGKFNRVPKDWRVPKGGVFDLWRQWWIGDSVRQIPPLQILEPKELKHLNLIPLAPEELKGRTGKYKDRRRDISKTWSDIRKIMKFILDNVIARGAFEDTITPAAVDRMFMAVADLFTQEERDAQHNWYTALLRVIKRGLVLDA
jgi:hypothetical protein